MKLSQIAIGLIIAGLVLGALSLAWPSIVGGKSAYTEEQAVEYQQASLELHNQSHAHPPADPDADDDDDGGEDGGETGQEHAHSTPGGESPELVAAQARMDAAEAKRDTAVNAGQTMSSVFRWLGILMAGCGIAAHFVAMRDA